MLTLLFPPWCFVGLFFIFHFLAVLGLHCCAGFSLVAVLRLVIMVASLVAEHGPKGERAQELLLPGSRAQAQYLWCVSLVALLYIGSFWTRDRTHVSCTGRWIRYHSATREAPKLDLECKAQ